MTNYKQVREIKSLPSCWWCRACRSWLRWQLALIEGTPLQSFAYWRCARSPAWQSGCRAAIGRGVAPPRTAAEVAAPDNSEMEAAQIEGRAAVAPPQLR